MTKYHGGKKRIGEEIAETIRDIVEEIEEDEGVTFKGYCEPFVGMAGIYNHIPELFDDHKPKLTFKAGDMNKSVIEMWKAAQKGWKPPTSCTETKFCKLKESNESTAEKGFIGHAYSFRGVYFGSYFDRPQGKHTIDNVLHFADNMKDVTFTSGPYTQFSNLRRYIIYCDPPYTNSQQHYFEESNIKSVNNFDTEAFWRWCEDMSDKGNLVFVSEFSKPRGAKAEVVWSKGKEKLYLVS